MPTDSNIAEKLEQLFGSFRAESLRDDLYPLFNEPEYFYYLIAPKSCLLEGGRGSGKTTALRCMTYEGQAALTSNDFSEPKFVGLYTKINTNTVASFSGPELNITSWQRFFGHFINLMICEEALIYIKWLKDYRKSNHLDAKMNYTRVGQALGFANVTTLNDLFNAIDHSRMSLEIYINNFGDSKPTISPLQTPVNILMEEMRELDGHKDTNFFIILDEYENFLDYQQKIVNTLIKHSGENYFFKIGVRELGWREKTTLNSSEVLISPADYERIQIEEKLENDFAAFAKRVCDARLRKADTALFGPAIDVETLLPGLSIKAEAIELGVSRHVETFRSFLLSTADTHRLLDLHDHELYVFQELNKQNLPEATKEIEDYYLGKKSSRERYENYAYSLLFSISGKGAKISKYYCGHSVLAKTTHQNIRFYMQLVNECIREQFAVGKSISEPIDAQLQTVAARNVGLSYLRELEGVSVQGGSLAKLLLGLGRLFQVMAANPVGGKPECNQFEMSEEVSDVDSQTNQEVRSLLIEAVMHLALVRTPGTKLTTASDVRSWDYAPHPIFAAYFGFSHRRKRKMKVEESDLIALTKQPQETIKKLLGRRAPLADEALPIQMSMFDEYFC
ncbi:ORC-CDC6 family AAA ATPase [Asticcacaulis taihuensis]|uniref:Uncharacterized protein n=1 Tax=Asticcacaulis taihuensis TaxID=260084 RepID=A0A1G4PV86_9CAUL|nr:hypothetical protein [Asticcacaulis taihuensis]SCW36210.1 hypothetical protein SAMN02927928_0691 [Asticcacaulis taihuensis]